jgi:hypothetical protein
VTAPVEDAEATCGYLLCHHRRYGCGWSTSYRNWFDERHARQLREIHEISCAWRPYPDLYA